MISFDSSKEIEKYLEQAEEVSGLDAEFDSVVSDSSLGHSVPAATRNTDYLIDNKVDLVQNPYHFSRLDSNQKQLVTVHEILEEKQFNGFLGDTLYETHGVSEEFRDFLNYAQTEFPNSLREGMTEAIAETLVPNGEVHGNSFYPEETAIFKTLLEGLDFDLGEELLDGEDPVGGYDTYVIEGEEPVIDPSGLYSSYMIEEKGIDKDIDSLLEISYDEFKSGEYSGESYMDSKYGLDIPDYEENERKYIEGMDGFIGTQEPETVQGEVDPAGNNFASAPF